MHQLTHLAGDHHRQRLAHAEAQRPAGRLHALTRATRAERRLRRAARPARRPRAQLLAQTAHDQ